MVAAFHCTKFKRSKSSSGKVLHKRVNKVSPYSVALCTLALIGITAMILIYLCLCAQIISCQYQVFRMKETKITLERERLNMRLEVNRLSSLERIETIARKELGMSHPPNRLILDMRQPSVLQASLEDVVAIETYGKTEHQ